MERACLSSARATFDGGFGDEERIGNLFGLHRQFGAAQQASTQEQAEQTDP